MCSGCNQRTPLSQISHHLAPGPGKKHDFVKKIAEHMYTYQTSKLPNYFLFIYFICDMNCYNIYLLLLEVSSDMMLCCDWAGVIWVKKSHTVPYKGPITRRHATLHKQIYVQFYGKVNNTYQSKKTLYQTWNTDNYQWFWMNKALYINFKSIQEPSKNEKLLQNMSEAYTTFCI